MIYNVNSWAPASFPTEFWEWSPSNNYIEQWGRRCLTPNFSRGIQDLTHGCKVLMYIYGKQPGFEPDEINKTYLEATNNMECHPLLEREGFSGVMPFNASPFLLPPQLWGLHSISKSTSRPVWPSHHPLCQASLHMNPLRVPNIK